MRIHRFVACQRIRVLFAVLTLVSWPNRGEGQALYYRSIPIGERAIGLGGAYTGIADDPSATFYNPAGLMSGGRFQLLGNLSSFEVARDRFDAGFSATDPSASADLRLSEEYRMRWWGVSFAMQVKERVSVGVSAFLANQSTAYRDDLGLAFGGSLGEDGVRIDGRSATSTTAIGVNYWGLVFRLGALYRINPRWQLGFMFQPPGTPIQQEGNIFRRLTGDLEAGSAFFLFDEGGLDTRSPVPFELRAGTEYRINAQTTLSIDFAVTGPVRDGNVFDRSGEIEALGVNLGAYFPNTTGRRTTPNAAIGAEHAFGKAVVAGGFFTNISAAPNLPETSDRYLPQQISLFGASVAVGIDTKGYRLTLGAAGFFGRGDALAFTVDREANVRSYRRTKANRSALLIYIAGALSVASKGAKEVQKKYQEKKASKSQQAGEDGDTDTVEPETGPP